MQIKSGAETGAQCVERMRGRYYLKELDKDFISKVVISRVVIEG